jgi:hypothetical protein
VSFQWQTRGPDRPRCYWNLYGAIVMAELAALREEFPGVGVDVHFRTRVPAPVRGRGASQRRPTIQAAVLSPRSRCGRVRCRSATLQQLATTGAPAPRYAAWCARIGEMSKIQPIIHRGRVAALDIAGQAIIPDALPSQEQATVKAM